MPAPSSGPPAVETEAWRLFVALTLPALVKNSIEQVQSALRRVLPSNQVRWTRPDQLHLTLKFLGNVEASRVPALVQALSDACRGSRSLALRAATVGFFPERGLPRVIWVGIQDESDRPLVRLQAAVERGVMEYTGEPAEKSFAGHVTLGRIKGIRRSEAAALAQAAAGLADHSLGEWSANRVDLIRSELTSAGAKYRTLASIELR